MASDYADNRIKQALKNAGGNAAHARQQIIAWAQEDQQLLYALTRPHLYGIVSYNIDRILSGRADTPKIMPIPEQSGTDDFGVEILRAVIDRGTAVFGLEGGAPPARRSAASQRHMDAIKQMASQSQTKKAPPKK